MHLDKFALTNGIYVSQLTHKGQGAFFRQKKVPRTGAKHVKYLV